MSLCAVFALRLGACASAHAAGRVELVLSPVDVAGVVTPSQAASFGVLVSNASSTPALGELAIKVAAYDGTTRSSFQHYQLAPGAHTLLAISLQGQPFGAYTVELRGAPDVAREPARQLRFVFARDAPLPAQALFKFGVCAHPLWGTPDEAAREMQAASRIGIALLRIGQEWASLEPKPGEWHWDKLDGLMAQARANHLEPQILLAFGNDDAADGKAHQAYELARARHEAEPWLRLTRSAPQDAPWRDFIARIVGRYKDRVKLWEVWNEPDMSSFFSGTIDEYIRMLRSAYQEIKRQDPQALVLTGGFATVEPHKARALNPQLQERVLAEASDAFDIHAYHEHSPFRVFARAVDGELSRMRARMPKPKPLYFNETGLPSAFGNEAAQAETLVKKITFARARSAFAFNWYDLRDDGADPKNPEHTFGLLTHDFQPKPAYAAYRELIARTAGLAFVRDLQPGDDRYAYLFGAAGRTLVVVWSENRVMPSGALSWHVRGAASLQQIDLMGNATVLPLAADDVLTIRPQREPVYLELIGSGGASPVLEPLTP